MRGTTGFNQERLIEAREARALTAVVLADLVGVSPQSISQYERGKTTPSHETLTRIAKALNLPIRFFTSSPSVEPGEQRVFWRSLSTATKQARKRAIRRFQWSKRIVDFLLHYVELPQLNLPSVDPPDNPNEISESFIEEAASYCREYWKIDNAPVADLTLLLENNGVIVLSTSLMASTLDSFSQIDLNRAWVVIGDETSSSVRARMSAAHELGHLILHSGLPITGYHSLIEQQAFRFATAFLLPEKPFVDELWTPGLDALLSLKDRWKVAVGGMIFRCQQLSLLTPEQTQRMWINYGRRGWRKREPLDDLIEPEQPRLIRRCFDMIIEEGMTSRQQILLELPIPKSDIESLCGLPEGYLSGDFDRPKVTPIKKRTREPSKGSFDGDVLEFKRR